MTAPNETSLVSEVRIVTAYNSTRVRDVPLTVRRGRYGFHDIVVEGKDGTRMVNVTLHLSGAERIALIELLGGEA